ncbi:MAG TPA: hydrogenase 4 subunit D, partial [Acidobacteriota bacterium]|nr:hydrogenase 4 subunit D [Acidobacteriota bacterium]
MSGLLATLVLVPIAGAFISYPLKSRLGDLIPALVAGLTFAVGVTSIILGYPHSNQFFIAQLPWLETSTPFLGFLLDPLSSLMLIVITLLGVLVVVYSGQYLGTKNRDHAYSEDKGSYYFWLLLFIGSMVGIAISPSFLQLFIFWEMTTMCSWALISYHRDSRSLFNGLKALIITYTGGTALLVALALIYVNTGSLAFSALDSLTPGLRMTVFILIVIAAWAKAAQIPFFTWLPDAMVAPTPISAYLHAAAMVKAGVYLVARTAVSNDALPHTAGLILAIMAVITIFATVILYFIQDDLKRLLAFSTIGHLGYILFGISLGIMGSTTGFAGGILHIINHACAKGLLFLSVGAIAYAAGTRSIKELSGLGRKLPVVSAGFIIGLFAVTGV